MKVMIAYVIIAHIAQLAGVDGLYALTSGPTTPEVSSFTPVGTSELVNVATGDFSYNIPLLDVGGYPINISYNTGSGMEDEASVVGFGWNLNVGAINRSMRGLPDEFKGDLVEKEFNMKPNKTWGLDVGLDPELIGIEIKKLGDLGKLGINIGGGIFYNNYRGFGTELSITPTLSASDKNKNVYSLGLGISINSKDGISFSPKVGLGREEEYSGLTDAFTKTTFESFTVISKNGSLSYNSRRGLTGLNFSSSKDNYFKVTSRTGNKSSISRSSKGFSSSSVSFNPTYTPQVKMPHVYSSAKLSMKLGAEAFAFFGNATLKGYVSSQTLGKKKKSVPAYGYLHLEDGIESNRQGKNDISSNEEKVRGTKKALLDFNREKESLPIIPAKKIKTDKDGNEKPLRGTQNLPVPQLTYDLYMVNSQGIGGQFRPYRSELGSVNDQVVKSASLGFNSIGNLNFDENTEPAPPNADLGLELGGGNLLRLGGDMGMNASFSHSGYWTSGRKFLKKAQFRGEMSPASPFEVSERNLYEPVYFKPVGEMSVETDPDFYNNLYGKEAIRPRIGRFARVHKTTNEFENKDDEVLLGKDYYHRNKRARRNTVLSYFDGKDAAVLGLDKQIKHYPLNARYDEMEANVELFPRTETPEAPYRENHHPSEIYIKDGSGMKHVFGIPAMNTEQHDVTFSTGDLDPVGSSSDGLVSYTPGNHNTKDNKMGLDEYYSRSKMPAHAYAYHLTAMLSPDYVDLKGDGITDDDLGTAYKFNYTRIHENFRWRAPFQKDMASHNEGLESKGVVAKEDPNNSTNTILEKNKSSDDKGLYTFGKKEIWLVNSIETKGEYGFVAEFKYEDQEGGLGVVDENGGKEDPVDPDEDRRPKKLKKLIAIELYSKKDRLQNGDGATPIKIVHFEYHPDYPLFKGVPNSTDALNPYNPVISKGKLTLKKVWFTYGKSNRARLNPYEFTYNGENNPGGDLNPTYKFKSQNGWGVYRANTGVPYNWEYPFVVDNPDGNTGAPNGDEIDTRVQACLLKEIKLPSGGRLEIEYESHDYAYVQDKHAMQMFKLLGVGKDENSDPDGTLLYRKLDKEEPNYDKSEGGYEEYNCVFIELPEAVDSDEFKNRYIRKMSGDIEGDAQEHIYLNTRVSVDPKYKRVEDVRRYEQIANYYLVDDSGIINDPGSSTTGKVAWIKLKPKKLRRGASDSNTKKEVNPISLNAWHFVRRNLNELIFLSSNHNLTEGEFGPQETKGLTTLMHDLKVMFTGYNNALRSKRVGDEIVPERSWVRLFDPYGSRKGGGARVAKIMLDDNYANMIKELPLDARHTNSNLQHSQLYKNSIYGQQYNYTTEVEDFWEEGVNGNVQTISSGVMSNLPGAIRPENPLVKPKIFLQRVALHPDNEIMMEEPLGEQFMPAPSIVYSKVTVESLQADRNSCNSSGFTVHEFYTAKDYPVRFEETQVAPRKTPSWLFLPFGNISEDLYTASQGYSVIKNDMHGKPERVSVYGKDPNEAFSIQEYHYRQDENKHLDNEGVKVIMPDGTRTSARIGIEMDAVVDERQNSSETFSAEFQANNDITVLGFPIIPIPTGWPKPEYHKTRLRTIVLSKVIHQFGILESVTAKSDGASITTKNEAWDAETGNVLLTSVKNEFNDDRYAFSYPARWAYDQLGAAYQNQDVSFYEQDNGTAVTFNELRAPDPQFGNTDYIPLSDLFGQGRDYTDYFVKGDKIAYTKARHFSISGQSVFVGLEKQEAWITKVWPTGIEVMDRDGKILSYGSAYAFRSLKVIESGRENVVSASMAGMTTTADPFVSNTLNPNTGKVLNASAIEYEDEAIVICAPLVKHPCPVCDNPSVAAQQFLAMLQELLDNEQLLSTTPTKINHLLVTTDNQGNEFRNDLGKALRISADDCERPTCDVYYEPELTYSAADPNCVLGLKVKFYEECPGNPNPVPLADCANGFDLNFDFSQFQNPGDGDLFCIRHITRFASIKSATLCEPGVDFRINAYIDFCDNQPNGFEEPVVITGNACFNISDNCGTYRPSETVNNDDGNNTCENYTDIVKVGDQINPYVDGLRGNWHPKRSHGYITGRTSPNLNYPNPLDPVPDPVNVNTNIRYDGVYDHYSPFWDYKLASQTWESDDTDWQWASQVTKFLPYNFDVENKSPLEIYSSAVYGYDYKLPVAVSGNAEFHQVTSVDFESKTDVASLCRARFLIGNGDFDPDLTPDQAHSGKQSLELDGNESISAYHLLKVPGDDNSDCPNPELDPEPLSNRLRDRDCLDGFAPSPDNYVLSVWVKTSEYDDYTEPVKPADYDKLGVEIFINGALAEYGEGANAEPVIESRSKIIDGWQQVSYRFTVEQNDVVSQAEPDIEIRFKNTNTDQVVKGFFDDFRIHPEDASMVSYVYDPIALKLVAQGDDRNYYTFYSYRPDGGMTGVMRETERGKQSLNYNEANAAKLNP